MPNDREAMTLEQVRDDIRAHLEPDAPLEVLRVWVDAIDAHLSRAAEPVGWQYFHADLWHLSESDEPWRSKGMPVREVFIHPSEDAQPPALETRHVDGVILKWHGIPVRVTGTVSTSAGNMKLIDAMAKANGNG